MNYLTFVSAFLALLSLAAADQGPVDWYECTGKRDGNYVHPYDCTKFMTCVAQLYAYERDCVVGLHYDPLNDRCEWPEIVGCITDPPATTAQPTTTTPTTTTPTTTTPTTTTPTTTTPTTTTPTTTTPTTTTPTTTENPIGDFCRDRPDGNYPHPTNCSKFISCVAGEFIYEMDCPEGLHYDPSTDQCDYPEIAGCDPRYTTATPDPTTPTTTTPTTTTPTTTTPTTTTPTTTTPTTTTPTTTTPTTTTPTTTTPTTTTPTTTENPIGDFCRDRPDGNYPHPTNCSKFISCVAGEFVYEMDCPEGLHYDPSTDQCDYPEIAGCDPRYTTATPDPTTTTTPTTTTPTTTTPTTTTPTTTTPTTTTPTTTTPTTTTPTTTTPTTTTPTTTTTNATTAAPTTTENPIGDLCRDRPDGNYPHPTNCSKFISCVAGEFIYEMDCPEGLHYDPSTDQCDYPEIAGCDPRYTATTPNPTTPTPGPTETTQTEETTTDVTTTAVPTTTTNQTSTSTELPPSTTTEEEEITGEPSTITTEDPPTTITTTEEVSTPESTTTEPPTTTTEDPDACDHDCEYVGIDCHNYYTCVNFTRKEYHECNYEHGLAFNPAIKVCDRIENVEGCRPDTTESPSTTPPTEEDDCICEYKPHETDCSKFYFCPDSCRPTSCQVRACPGDLLWSVDFYGDGSEHQQCARPGDANCVSEGAGGARLEFSCYKKSDGLYRNERDCRSYWKCQGGKGLLYDCPKGYVYNGDTKSCDFAARSLRFCVNNEQI